MQSQLCLGVILKWSFVLGCIVLCNLAIQVEDRRGMLADISTQIAGIDTNIKKVEATTSDDQRGRISVTVEVRDVEHLDQVVKSLRGVTGVLDVERAAR